MKNLKIIFYLVLTTGIIASCEKETEILPENAEFNNQKIEVKGTNSHKSILETIESGVDLETYFKSLGDIKKMEVTKTLARTDDFVPTSLQFFYSDDDFPCSNLPTQNFLANNYGSSFAVPLNEYTNNYQFSPSDILSGISFDLTTETENIRNNGFFIPSNSWGYPNILMSNYWEGDLVLNFTNNNVVDVNMKLFNLVSSEMYVSVYGASENYLGQTSVYYGHPNYEGVYVGVQSVEPIAKIIISSGYIYGYEGVDEVSFGTCDDIDGDGVLNENDAYPNSNMSEKINIKGCNPNVNNVLVRNGAFMMDQIDALIDEINSEYSGRNYDYLNRKFIMELERKVTDWRRNRLVNNMQRDAISRCARSARIPYSDR